METLIKSQQNGYGMTTYIWSQRRTQQLELVTSLLLYCCYMMTCQTSEKFVVYSAKYINDSDFDDIKKQIGVKASGSHDNFVSSTLSYQIADVLSMPMSVQLEKTKSVEMKHSLVEYSNINEYKNAIESNINYTKSINLHLSNMGTAIHSSDVGSDALRKTRYIIEDLLALSIMNTSNTSRKPFIGFDYDIATSFEDSNAPSQDEFSSEYPKIQINHNWTFLSPNISNGYAQSGHHLVSSSSDELLLSTMLTNNFSIATNFPRYALGKKLLISASQTFSKIQNPESLQTTMSIILQSSIAYGMTLTKSLVDLTSLRSEEMTDLATEEMENKMINNATKTTFIHDKCPFTFSKPLTHEFIIIFNFTSEGKEHILQHLRDFFNDTNCFIQMTTFIAGKPTIFSWTNSSLDNHQCSTSDIEKVWLRMVENDGQLRKNLVSWFLPVSTIQQIQKRYLTPCIETKPSTLQKEIAVLMALILSFLFLILLLIICKKLKFFKYKKAQNNNALNEAFALKSRKPAILMMERT